LWVGERIILKLILMKQAERDCTGLIWLRIGTRVGLFAVVRYRTMRDISVIISELSHRIR
jgi:hypothetical protein